MQRSLNIPVQFRAAVGGGVGPNAEAKGFPQQRAMVGDAGHPHPPKPLKARQSSGHHLEQVGRHKETVNEEKVKRFQV